jgi:hypothetical protein
MQLQDFWKSGLPLQCLYDKKPVTAHRTKKGLIQIGYVNTKERWWVDPSKLELPKPVIEKLQDPQVLENTLNAVLESQLLPQEGM